MSHNLLLYLFYGLIAGFSELTPLSASAHQALFPMLFRFDSTWPMLRFFVHAGSLTAIVLHYRDRINHIRQEMKLVSSSPRQRKRPPDMDAVLDARFIFMSVAPALLGAICSAFLFRRGIHLLTLSVLLIAGAALIYIPDYLPGGDRKTWAMSPLEGLLMGLCAGCSIIPGVSRVGLMLVFALLRKCDRTFILDIVILISGVMLAALMLVDAFSFLISGLSGLSFLRILGCLLAACASFGGGVGAILMMRFLAVKTGFSGFAFCGWGLGLVTFVLYLMV